MQGLFYPEVFERLGMVVVQPSETDQLWVHDRYVGQLLKGEFRDDTRLEFTSLIARLREEERIDGVILGGTELPLLLRADSLDGMPLLDTAKIHVNDALARMVS